MGQFPTFKYVLYRSNFGFPACSSPHLYLCGNGVCTYADYHCDGYDDCGDNSDEMNCGESVAHFCNII